ncbi:MAG: PKD domain-containing protein [bacterium]|nr:PKD domain-containing protein [bacterium]
MKIISRCFFVLVAIVLLQGCKEAKLVAPDQSLLVVSVNPASIPAGGSSIVQVLGFKPSGTPLPDGTVIYFSTDLGSIETNAETDNGVARVTFSTTGGQSGIANIQVTSGTAVMSPESVTITIGAASLSYLDMSAEPSSLPSGGGSSRIVVIARDDNRNPLEDIPVTFSADAGQFSSGQATLYTDENGRVEDTLQTTTTTVVYAASGDITMELTINVATDESPTAAFSISPTSAILNQTVYFNASTSSDDDGQIDSYEWDFGDGKSATGVSTSHRYRDQGTFSVVLTVRDNGGNTASASETVTVTQGDAPSAIFVFSPTSPQANETIYFNASGSSDDDGQIVSYEWDFGDGDTASGMTTDHTFLTAGSYKVTLVVYDDADNHSSKTEAITVL